MEGKILILTYQHIILNHKQIDLKAYLFDNTIVPDRKGKTERKDTDTLKCRVLLRHDIF